MITVEELYTDYELLMDESKPHEELASVYARVLNGVKGDVSTKKLASQLIGRFFHKFPEQANEALAAILELCADSNIQIRKQAIIDLPSLCKDNRENVGKVTDILAQLLQTSDNSELQMVTMSLATVFQLDPKAALVGMFHQINNGLEIVRTRTISWMETKMKTLPVSLWTRPIEDYMIEETKKVLYDVTGAEFLSFMRILTGLNYTSTVQGRQQLMDIVVSQAMLDVKFEPTDSDGADRLLQCGQQALQFASRNVHATGFLGYIIEQVLPVLEQLPASTGPEDVNFRLELLKLLAEMSAFAPDLANVEQHIGVLYNQLAEHMPLPSEQADSDVAQADAPTPRLQYSVVECLLYAFHELNKLKPDYLAAFSTDDATNTPPGLKCSMAELRKRLQYFAQNCQLHMKCLKTDLQSKSPDELKSDENKLKIVALKTTTTVSALIKDLLHKPPMFKAQVTLSWKPLAKRASSDGTESKNGDTNSAGAAKQARRDEMAHYRPPSGKFSNGVSPQSSGGASRGGFRGGRARGVRRW